MRFYFMQLILYLVRSGLSMEKGKGAWHSPVTGERQTPQKVLIKPLLFLEELFLLLRVDVELHVQKQVRLRAELLQHLHQ